MVHVMLFGSIVFCEGQAGWALGNARATARKPKTGHNHQNGSAGGLSQ